MKLSVLNGKTVKSAKRIAKDEIEIQFMDDSTFTFSATDANCDNPGYIFITFLAEIDNVESVNLTENQNIEVIKP